MKPSKENVVNSVLEEIEKGTKYAVAASLLCTKFHFSTRTFAKYWKAAQERFAVIAQERQQKIREQSDTATLDRMYKAIMTRDEALENLSRIAKGEASYEDVKSGDVVEVPPTFYERISAIKLMSDLEGWNAAKRIQHEVDSVQTVEVIIIPPSEEEEE